MLRIQTQTVGRVEVTEKPELIWDDPALDRLYERLAVEYELRDRDLALSRKLKLISRTAETYLELLFNRRSLRVEWYILTLIAFEDRARDQGDVFLTAARGHLCTSTKSNSVP